MAPSLEASKPKKRSASSLESKKMSKKDRTKKKRKKKTDAQKSSKKRVKKSQKHTKKNKRRKVETEDPVPVIKNVDENVAEELPISIEGDESNKIVPFNSFAQLPVLPPKITACFKGFSKPTPIQANCWPAALRGDDVVGVAETGSGKTLAFGVPALSHVSEINRSNPALKKKVSAVVLAPTRELAMQVFEVFQQASPKGVRCACVYGGVPKWEQKKYLFGANVIVGTPGRLIDFIDEGACDVSSVSFMILDEADRMLDLGFEPSVRKILSQMPSPQSGKRQTVMFSATWPASVRELAAEFMRSRFIKVTIGEDELTANRNVTQRVEVVDEREKRGRLLQLLKKYHSSRNNRVLIFALYKKEAANLHKFVASKGYKVAAIHGDLSQAARTSALDSFRSGKCPLLIATDVAARGIDVPNVEVVINVSFPLTIEDYVHRIGRTGRAGSKGASHTLFTSHDKRHAGALVNLLRENEQEVPDEITKFGLYTKKKEPVIDMKKAMAQSRSSKITFSYSDDED